PAAVLPPPPAASTSAGSSRVSDSRGSPSDHVSDAVRRRETGTSRESPPAHARPTSAKYPRHAVPESSGRYELAGRCRAPFSHPRANDRSDGDRSDTRRGSSLPVPSRPSGSRERSAARSENTGPIPSSPDRSPEGSYALAA